MITYYLAARILMFCVVGQSTDMVIECVINCTICNEITTVDCAQLLRYAVRPIAPGTLFGALSINTPENAIPCSRSAKLAGINNRV